MKFEILLALQVALEKIEKETNFRFVIDKNNAEIYCFEPNSKESFDKINIQKELKESKNGNPIKRPDSTSVERCSSNVIERVRGIIQERSRRSRARIEKGEEFTSANRNLQEFSTYGNGYSHIRASLSQRQKQLEEEIKQSQTYKQKALKSYQQQGVSLTPINTKEILTRCQEALRADKGFRTEQTLKTTAKYLAKDCNISQQEAQKWLNTALEIEKQQESKQEKQSQITQNIQEIKQEIKSQSKAIPKESKKEIPKPISKTKSTTQTKSTKEPYRGR
ncbi:hypothetical protein [Helicobacter sp. MIT 05-5294]|uniref:hypothetical protein n=1 Tax=Helicobacter sp. MIT 05-5294 TaxID=1548150 RepID=UPI00051FB823|nr:hypothetical protein [Helicobacter sp. MIT 05-5294]TLD85557.1 hypothetical protein LS69_008900 [Helicobacter sp. MIT 05-5294]